MEEYRVEKHGDGDDDDDDDDGDGDDDDDDGVDRLYRERSKIAELGPEYTLRS